MFARDKRIGPYTYVYLVENVREEGRTKQRIIANLGRKEVVVARGDLDRLARSVVPPAQRSMVLSLVEGEPRDALGLHYYARGAAPGAGYRNGYRTGRVKSAEGAIEYSTPQIADRSEPFR